MDFHVLPQHEQNDPEIALGPKPGLFARSDRGGERHRHINADPHSHSTMSIRMPGSPMSWPASPITRSMISPPCRRAIGELLASSIAPPDLMAAPGTCSQSAEPPKLSDLATYLEARGRLPLDSRYWRSADDGLPPGHQAPLWPHIASAWSTLLTNSCAV